MIIQERKRLNPHKKYIRNFYELSTSEEPVAHARVGGDVELNTTPYFVNTPRSFRGRCELSRSHLNRDSDKKAINKAVNAFQLIETWRHPNATLSRQHSICVRLNAGSTIFYTIINAVL